MRERHELPAIAEAMGELRLDIGMTIYNAMEVSLTNPFSRTERRYRVKLTGFLYYYVSYHLKLFQVVRLKCITLLLLTTAVDAVFRLK